MHDFPYFYLIRHCWHYAGAERWRMVLFYGMTTLANIAGIAMPFMIGQLINTLQRGGPNLLADATQWLMIYVALVFVFWMLHGPSRVIERNLAFRIKTRFLQSHYEGLTKLPMRWHQEHHSGNTANRINKASAGLYEFADFQFVYVQNIVQIIGAFIALAIISPVVSAAEFLFTVTIFLSLIGFDRYLIRKLAERNEREHDYSSAFFDYLTNIGSVISFNLARPTVQILAKYLAAIFVPLRGAIIANEWKYFLLCILIALAEFTILYTYIRMGISEGSTLMLGNIVAIYQYMTSLNRVFFDFADLYQRLIQHSANLRAGEPLREAFDRLGVRDEGKKELKITQGEIEFKDIHFSYRGTKQVFEGLSLHILPHQKVGLVGRSGAGKTTLAHLLLRFYDTSKNDILIDGQHINEVTQDSLREQIAVIPQDTSLFETSLMENIRFGKLTATDEEVIAAAKKAHAHEFIAQMPGGYHALVGERGVKLSGGQRQRIAIARAVLKNAPILILDEATSALDSESEKFIQETLKELMLGKTVIVIAHRLSTIAHMDRLVILDNGRIIEDGSHGELLRQNGHYARLWAMQSGGFLPD